MQGALSPESWLTVAGLSEARPCPEGPPREEAKGANTCPDPALRWPPGLLVGRWEVPCPLTAGGALPPMIREAGPGHCGPLAPILSP